MRRHRFAQRSENFSARVDYARSNFGSPNVHTDDGALLDGPLDHD
jgi:hypothetical protein